MGCGSSKAAANAPAASASGNDAAPSSPKTETEDAEAPPAEEPKTEEQQETPEAEQNGSGNGVEDGQEPVAFEIPVENDDEDSIIKKHPPKRFQRLEDQQINLTHEDLEEKQQEVEDRRQKMIQQRIMSSRQSAHHRKRIVKTDQIEEGDGMETNETKEEDITDF